MEYYGHNRNVCRAPIQYWRVPRYTYVVQRASNSAMEKNSSARVRGAGLRAGHLVLAADRRQGRRERLRRKDPLALTRQS